MPSFSTKSISVRQLFNWFDEARFAVPDIQREFVWNSARACALLDSLYKGYPVGTAMVWTTGKAQINLLRHNLHILPSFDPYRNKEVQFLIDGQQRLSVLHKVRQAESITNSDGKVVPFGNICFDLVDSEKRFRAIKRPDPDTQVPVHQILSPRWKSLFKHLSAPKRRKIADCRQRLLDYQLPFIFMEATELSDVRETFIRINTQGMKMSESDRAFSTASRVKPLHRFRTLCQHLHTGYQSLDKGIYWMAIGLVRGIPDLGQKATARLTREIDTSDEGYAWFNREEPKISECLRLACDYLVHTLKVETLADLPYEAMVAMLALFFHANNRAQPQTLQRRQIQAWFWHTAVLKRYAGSGYRRNILADAEFFRKLGQTRKGTYDSSEKAPRSVLLNEDYSGASALSAAFRLVLARQNPGYLDNGEPILLGQTASRRNARELHHIWPRELLRRHGVSPKRFNTICNICFLAAQDNRSFGARHPLSYLEDYWSRKHFARVMKSHLIPYQNQSPLWDDKVPRGFKAFIEERRRLIETAFNTAAGIRLFEK